MVTGYVRPSGNNVNIQSAIQFEVRSGMSDQEIKAAAERAISSASGQNISDYDIWIDTDNNRRIGSNERLVQDGEAFRRMGSGDLPSHCSLFRYTPPSRPPLNDFFNPGGTTTAIESPTSPDEQAPAPATGRNFSYPNHSSPPVSQPVRVRVMVNGQEQLFEGTYQANDNYGLTAAEASTISGLRRVGANGQVDAGDAVFANLDALKTALTQGSGRFVSIAYAEQDTHWHTYTGDSFSSLIRFEQAHGTPSSTPTTLTGSVTIGGVPVPVNVSGDGAHETITNEEIEQIQRQVQGYINSHPQLFINVRQRSVVFSLTESGSGGSRVHEGLSIRFNTSVNQAVPQPPQAPTPGNSLLMGVAIINGHRVYFQTTGGGEGPLTDSDKSNIYMSLRQQVDLDPQYFQGINANTSIRILVNRSVIQSDGSPGQTTTLTDSVLFSSLPPSPPVAPTAPASRGHGPARPARQAAPIWG